MVVDGMGSRQFLQFQALEGETKNSTRRFFGITVPPMCRMEPETQLAVASLDLVYIHATDQGLSQHAGEPERLAPLALVGMSSQPNAGSVDEIRQRNLADHSADVRMVQDGRHILGILRLQWTQRQARRRQDQFVLSRMGHRSTRSRKTAPL